MGPRNLIACALRRPLSDNRAWGRNCYGRLRVHSKQAQSTAPTKRVEAIRAGVTDYLILPVSPRVLIDRIQQVLQKRPEACRIA